MFTRFQKSSGVLFLSVFTICCAKELGGSQDLFHPGARGLLSSVLTIPDVGMEALLLPASILPYHHSPEKTSDAKYKYHSQSREIDVLRSQQTMELRKRQYALSVMPSPFTRMSAAPTATETSGPGGVMPQTVATGLNGAATTPSPPASQAKMFTPAATAESEVAATASAASITQQAGGLPVQSAATGLFQGPPAIPQTSAATEGPARAVSGASSTTPVVSNTDSASPSTISGNGNLALGTTSGTGAIASTSSGVNPGSVASQSGSKVPSGPGPVSIPSTLISSSARTSTNGQGTTLGTGSTVSITGSGSIASITTSTSSTGTTKTVSTYSAAAANVDVTRVTLHHIAAAVLIVAIV